MCAAISIVRKKIAYEDKPNYIDSILSELDEKDYISVYDRTRLGSGVKAELKKVPVDFTAAIAKGYRIIDASASQWMQIASQTGYSGNSLNNYTPFDENNFDINTDSFFNARFEDSELRDLQAYYQSLVKACDVINNYRASEIKRSLSIKDAKQSFADNVRAMQDLKQSLRYSVEYFNFAYNYSPKINSKYLSEKEINKIVNKLLSLEKKYSYEIKQNDNYSYIDNEEEINKKEKIKNYLKDTGLSENCLTDNIITRIYEAVTSYNYFKELTENNQTTSRLAKASNLYEIGANTRYQFSQGLKNEPTLNYMMKKERIPNKEQCIIELSDKLLKKLSESDPDTSIIIKSLYNNTGGAVTNKKEAIDLLEDIKLRVNKITNDEINELYDAINLHDKTEALIQHLESIQLEIANDNKKVIADISEDLGLKKAPDKLFEALEEIKKGLVSNEYKYEDIFNKIGASSQLLFLEDEINALTDEASSEDIQLLLGNIQALKNELEIYTGFLNIRDEEGNLLYSAEPANILIKQLENNGTVPTEKALKELQTHFDRIQKNRSADEFNSRQGKLSDKSLYKFSRSEQYTLSSIKRNLTPISRYLKKQLAYVQEYIKIPLEELKRMIGVDIGSWWVPKEGESGLYGGQDIRILEYITGRPHYLTGDLKKAIKEIKTKPYSGISSSSVYHNKIGMHAQYIADIEPVKIKTQNGLVKEEDVLFQDNTWGATEHENVWTDSNGLKRTDYSDYRGGTLGYITNDKFRNGNLVNRVLKEMVLEEEPEIVNSKAYKKIRKDYDSTYSLPQYREIVLDGKSEEAKDIAESLYDTIFTPTSNLVETMQILVKNMTAQDIKNRIHSIANFKNEWETISDKLIQRMLEKADGKFIIDSEEDYNKLSDNDNLKIILEKAALLNNYRMDDLRLNLAKIKNVNELKRYKNVQRQRAIKDFEYSFGKNVDILDYLVDAIDDKHDRLIKNFLDKNNITLTEDEFSEIFYELELNTKNFDGSIKHVINEITEFVYQKIAPKINSAEQEQELKNLLHNIYAQMLYFNKDDITNPKIEHIIKFIDKTYNPSDDAELVKIYRDFQDLTKNEFDAQVVPVLTDADLNIKDKTGYQILQEIRRHEEEAENTINNLIFSDEIKNKTENSVPYNKYSNYKLNRKTKVLSKYTFDSAYRTMKNDLALLNLDKLFGKYKGNNLNKYGAYPAYPKVDYISESVIKAIANAFVTPIKNQVEQITAYYDLKKYYQLSDQLKDFTHKHKSTAVLNEAEYKELNNILGNIYTLSNGDDSQTIVNEAAEKALEIEMGQQFKEYRNYISDIVNMINGYKKAVPIKTIEQNIEDEKIMLSKQAEMLAKTYIRDRYQNKVYQTVNNYKKYLINGKKDSDGNYYSDSFKEDLLSEIEEYNILQEPVELLHRYLKSLAKDSELNKYNKSLEDLLKRALIYAKLCDVQSIVMHAISSGIETDVKNAFKDIRITLSNGASIPMSTDRVIADYFVHGLIVNDNEETALFLLDKLGLSETYVNYICKSFDYDNLKNIIEDSAKEFNNYKQFTISFDNAYKEAIDKIEGGTNPMECLDNFKKNLSEAAKKYSIAKSHSKIFLNAADLCKENLKESPYLAARDAITSIFEDAATLYNNLVNEHLSAANELLDSYESIMHVTNNVLLKLDSQAYKNREKINKKYNSLIRYYNSLFGNLQAEK